MNILPCALPQFPEGFNIFKYRLDMNFYYIFANGNNWIKLSGDGKNPAKCSNVKFTCNEGNEDLKFVNDPISDYITSYRSVLNYADHSNNLYVQANKFGYLLKYGYKFQENNFIPFDHNKVILLFQRCL